ncbi:hypothetical protein CJU94_36025 (plasmid) [Paraburkholderia aromaticivorans]|uniref:DUF2325 domain-containing protein n=2 Tax=Paraburkholderia aromaticivorans TaxID=2026199 RepID=A0A248VWZ6_9BURK|nr:hypothetical protein CJU94_36025 [Paraburkholderia aromaticivorans]
MPPADAATVTAAVRLEAQPVMSLGACVPESTGRLSLERARAHVASLQRELFALEQVLLDGEALTRALSGRRLVYVGGRPDSNAALRALVRSAGGEIVHHLGTIDEEGRTKGFASLLAGADRVLCPLDLIDPDSLVALRGLCARYRVPWSALRTSSVTSFIAGVLRVRPADPRRVSAASRFCLRHG